MELDIVTNKTATAYDLCTQFIMDWSTIFFVYCSSIFKPYQNHLNHLAIVLMILCQERSY